MAVERGQPPVRSELSRKSLPTILRGIRHLEHSTISRAHAEGNHFLVFQHLCANGVTKTHALRQKEVNVTAAAFDDDAPFHVCVYFMQPLGSK